MRDKVFIAWSGSSEAAMLVKNLLERQYNYICSIGGNMDNNSKFSSVGDTVIQQIKTCNQAIVIFQNRADGAVSNNLFFELGYVLALYGQKKVHCVKKLNEEVILPSDFDNSFVTPIKDNSNLNDFAQGIVDYFIARQKMSINENKMFLINNRYIIRDKINSHYSEAGSKCSDYELAQYILFYMQASHMFGDEKKIYQEILDFKNQHGLAFSNELSLSVNLCLTFFEMVNNIKYNEELSEVYIDEEIFWESRSEYVHYAKNLVSDDLGIFDEWASVFIYEQLTFAYMLIANNHSFDLQSRLSFHKQSKDYALISLDMIHNLEKNTPSKENNDSIGLISLIKAYIYRNLYLSKKELKENDAGIWLKKTMEERKSLKNHFGRGAIDTQLYNNFCMEYYLSLVNYLTYDDLDEKINELEISFYKREINNYVESVKKNTAQNIYLKQIMHWCKS